MRRARGPRQKRSGAGFTLLELMVVIGIFGVLAAMAYGGLNSVLGTRQRIADSLARTAALQKAYLRLRNDFQQLRARPARDGYGESQPALVVSRDGVVEFTRGGWRNPLSQPRSSLERVAYHLDDDRRLVRASWRVLDRAQDSEPVEVVLLDRVESVGWRFLDAAQEWHDAWPAATLTAAPGAVADAPPSAVELNLDIEDIGEVRLLFSASNAAPKP